MGFNKVYRSLQEIFPQIDSRVLRAVAIEHSKDADAAVEAVLVEIIPFFSERSRPGTPPIVSISEGKSYEATVGAASNAKNEDVSSVNAVGPADVQNSSNVNGGKGRYLADADGGHSEPFYDSYTGEGNTDELVMHERIENGILKKIDVDSHVEDVVSDKNGSNTLQLEVSRNTETDETIATDTCPGSNINISSDNIPSPPSGTLQDLGIGGDRNMNLFQEKVVYGNLETGNVTNEENDKRKFTVDCKSSMADPPLLTVHDPTASPSGSSVQLVVLPDMNVSNLEELDVSWPTSTGSQIETTSNVVGTEDESALNTSISRSRQIQIMDVLEEIIADARNNKKTLFSAMESVINLMKEVELKEQAAEQAKVEAAMGGTDILVKLEELKQFVQQAKDANGMRAGEVYGEKAILATELRELQSRVLSLSDERDKSLAVLDEMHQTLEVRLAAAENEIKSAEQEKIEKEKAAVKALADQELIMEKVVQESKILKQQAEDNAMLQEFLMDRGRVVDMLQGEIAVICQDVRLLKEKFDEHVPFSKSLSSSQTSCILASSSSSLKSLTPLGQGESMHNEPDSLETQEKGGSLSGSYEQSTTIYDREKTSTADYKVLLDDGWELFDNREIYD